MRRIVLALVFALTLTPAVAVSAETAKADAESAPDCSVFSIEGVRVRMTIDEARAATPGWKWNAKGKSRWRLAREGKGPTARMDVYIGADGRVIQVIRDYTYFRFGGTIVEAEMAPATLDKAMDDRFGAVATKADSTVHREPDSFYGEPAVYTTTCWVSIPCDMHACMDDGSRWRSDSDEAPVLQALVGDTAVANAVADAEAAKVKF